LESNRTSGQTRIQTPLDFVDRMNLNRFLFLAGFFIDIMDAETDEWFTHAADFL